MKERLTLAVSWWCFAHASLLGLFVISFEVFDAGRGDFGVFAHLVEGYFDLFQVDALIIGLPFIGWVVLWIVTGSPRILPWRK